MLLIAQDLRSDPDCRVTVEHPPALISLHRQALFYVGATLVVRRFGKIGMHLRAISGLGILANKLLTQTRDKNIHFWQIHPRTQQRKHTQTH